MAEALTLLITRGLPASGKTTFAREWVAEDRAHRARINRDDFRAMLDDSVFIKDVTEPRIVTARDAAILALLGKGVSVINNDTNLPQRAARDLARLARRAGAVLQVEDFTHVPVKTCIERDACRLGRAYVGGPVIVDMHARYLAGRELPLPWPDIPEPDLSGLVPYVPVPGTPEAVLCDIDGTAARMAARSPFDETRVHEDRPNLPVLTVLRAMQENGKRILFISGRTDGCRAATYRWLLAHTRFPFDQLLMRPVGDARQDAQVKLGLFNDHIRVRYDVRLVLDDRLQCIRLWEALGLNVLPIGEGRDF